MLNQTVGILGGMGPAATAYFYETLVRRTPATTDQEHLRVVMWADPTVPDRIAAANGEGPSVEPALSHGLEVLKGAGATLLACPCNTAHLWLPRLAGEAGLPLVNIVQETVAACLSEPRASGSIGILGTTPLIESGLYQHALRDADVEPMTPQASEQEDLVSAIVQVKTGDSVMLDKASATMSSILDSLAARGATVVIAGCTEVSVLAARQSFALPVMDSLICLADAVIDQAKQSQ